MTPSTTIRHQISLSNIPIALDMMDRACGSLYPDFKNEVLLHKARTRVIACDARRGVLETDEYYRQYAKISSDIISLLSDMETAGVFSSKEKTQRNAAIVIVYLDRITNGKVKIVTISPTENYTISELRAEVLRLSGGAIECDFMFSDVMFDRVINEENPTALISELGILHGSILEAVLK